MICMEKPLELAYVSLQAGWVWVSGNHQALRYVTCLPVLVLSGVGEGSSKEEWPMPALLPGSKLSFTSSLYGDGHSVPLHMSLVPFKPVPQHCRLE